MTENIKIEDEMGIAEEPKTEMNTLLELAETTDYQVQPLTDVQLNEGMREPIGITEIKILLGKMDALSQLMFPDAEPMSFQLGVTRVFSSQYFDDLEAENDIENEVCGNRLTFRHFLIKPITTHFVFNIVFSLHIIKILRTKYLCDTQLKRHRMSIRKH